MSILDDEAVMNSNSKVRKYSPLLEGHTESEYKTLLDFYYTIRNFYQDYFEKKCSNGYEKAIENIKGDAPRWTSEWSKEEFEELRDYVFSLPFPASWSEMMKFLKEVVMGDLEVLCRIPFKGPDGKETTSLDEIRKSPIRF